MAVDFENRIDDTIEFECRVDDNIEIDLSTVMAVKVPLPIALQDKDIEPTTSEQVVNADKGFSGLGTVKVGAVTSDIDENITARNIRGGVTILGVTGDLEPDKPDQSKVVEPSMSEQVITADSGYELASVTIKPVTAEIDSDIVAENIRKDTEILGVVGTMEAREDLDTELAEQETLIAELESGVNELPDKPVDRLQWKCDNMQKLDYEFQDYKGTSLDEVLNGLDTSKVKSMNRTFSGCTYIKNFPLINTENVENIDYMHTSDTNLESVPKYDLSKVTSSSNSFAYCGKLKTLEVDLPNSKAVQGLCQSCSTLEEVNLNLPLGEYLNGICSSCSNLKTAIINSKPLGISNAFYYCKRLETLKGIDMIKTNETSQAFTQCKALTNLELKNIKTGLVIGSGTSYGHLLTLDSLLNTIKELHINTGTSTLTLTVGSANLEKLANVYVKLVDITDEMRAEDEYIDNKAPFVQCESTDDGAMLITEYVTTVKNWKLA